MIRLTEETTRCPSYRRDDAGCHGRLVVAVYQLDVHYGEAAVRAHQDEAVYEQADHAHPSPPAVHGRRAQGLL